MVAVKRLAVINGVSAKFLVELMIKYGSCFYTT